MYELISLSPATGAVAGIRVDSRSAAPRDALIDRSILPIRQIIGIGRNYAEHAREQHLDAPERPLIFTKNPASVLLHEQDILIPSVCHDADGAPLPFFTPV